MLNAIADGTVEDKTEAIQFVHLAATKRGFAGSNAMLLSGDALLQEPTESTFNGRILVVEDNDVDQKRIWKILEKCHCDFHMVSSGEDAIKALKIDESYSLALICESSIPCASEIRAAGRSHMKLVGVCANDMDEQQCQTVSVEETIKKPVNMSNLCTLMDQWELERQIRD